MFFTPFIASMERFVASFNIAFDYAIAIRQMSCACFCSALIEFFEKKNLLSFVAVAHAKYPDVCTLDTVSKIQ